MPFRRGAILGVLARHIGRPASTLHPWQDLHRDLEMTWLDLVLVVLELEGVEGERLGVDGLERVRTVGELVTHLTREVARARLARSELDVA